MSLDFGTATPVSVCPKPPIDRDRWRIQKAEISFDKGKVYVNIVSALMDGQTPKGAEKGKFVIDWSQAEAHHVGAATTFGEVLEDMLEDQAKQAGMMPDQAVKL